MVKKVVPYSIKLTETYILAFVKDVSTYVQTLIVKG